MAHPPAVSSLDAQTLHVGDRFTTSGNDTATRDVCSVLWVANPEETAFFIKVDGAVGCMAAFAMLLDSLLTTRTARSAYWTRFRSPDRAD